MSDRPIRLILDTSAIIAYGRESIDVGETIAEVSDGGAAFGLPILCLAEAYDRVTSERLELVLGNPTCTLLTVPVVNWRQLAVVRELLGRLDTAASLPAASDNLTAEPASYEALGDNPPVIPI